MDRKQKRPESETADLVGNFYPVWLDRSHETATAIYEGLTRCYDRNPDPGFSVFKLVSRLDELVVFSHHPESLALVCEERIDDYGNKYLFLWGAYANDVKYNMKKAYGTLKWAAASLNCQYIETVSQRAGWVKLLERLDDVETIPTITYRITM